MKPYPKEYLLISVMLELTNLKLHLIQYPEVQEKINKLLLDLEKLCSTNS